MGPLEAKARARAGARARARERARAKARRPGLLDRGIRRLAARRVDALEAGDYEGAGPGEEEDDDLAERSTQSLLEDASGGY